MPAAHRYPHPDQRAGSYLPMGQHGRRIGARPAYRVDRKSTRLNSSHTEIYTLSLHDALPILLLINNDQVKELLTPGMTREALRTAYDELARGDAVCRPRIDIRIPTSEPDHIYQWGSMEGGSVRGRHTA